jgi:hypothetical protein
MSKDGGPVTVSRPGFGACGFERPIRESPFGQCQSEHRGYSLQNALGIIPRRDFERAAESIGTSASPHPAPKQLKLTIHQS